MKYRSDFVTNSSSSSFIVARKGKLNKAQKKALLEVLEEELLGEEVLKPGATEEEIDAACDEYSEMKYHKDQIKELLEEGKMICVGEVIFDGMHDDYGSFLQRLWDVIEENGDFDQVDTDLDF